MDLEKLLDSFYLPGSALFYIQVFWGIDFILKYLLTEYDFDYIASACMFCLLPSLAFYPGEECGVHPPSGPTPSSLTKVVSGLPSV